MSDTKTDPTPTPSTDDATADQGDVTATAPEPGSEDTPDGADALGDPGKRALDAMKSQRNEYRDKLRAAEARLAELEKSAPSDVPDPAKLREEILAEVNRSANERVKRAELRAAAKGVFADPEDALLFVDLGAIEVDEDGNVDASALKSALDSVLERKPHLAAQRGAVHFDTSRGKDSAPAQLTREQVRELTPEAFAAAKAEGRLDALLGRR